jgi:hypothetical protein
VAKQMQLHDRKNQVEQVFKVGTHCWENQCSRASMIIQKGDAKASQNKGKMKTQRSTSGKTLQWSSPRG